MSRPPYGTTVPGNRWDLAPQAVDPSAGARSVSVVVTHYEQPAALARTLAAVARQSVPVHQVVVADDGSATAPTVPHGVELVRQDDRGFRAAAARNLGAAHATGDLLVFLDADTAPEPEFVARLTARVGVLPELLAVGRRRHADLAAGPGPLHELPEPRWLREAYTRTRDLVDADATAHRFVISSVLACSRWWFEELGGFDETFTAYGGEDWELAHRSRLAGGLVAHEPRAVAWHDGPDAGGEPRVHAGSGEDPALTETLAVADRVGAPGTTYRGLLLGPTDLVVTADAGLTRTALTLTLDGLLEAAPRARVRLDAHAASWYAADPRVAVLDDGGPLDAPGGRGPRLHLHLAAGLVGAREAWTTLLTSLDGSGEVATREVVDGRRPLASLRDLRLHRRARRWARPELAPAETLAPPTGLRPTTPDTTLEAWLGGWA